MKFITTLLALLLTSSAITQPFFDIQMTNIGAGLNAGLQLSNPENGISSNAVLFKLGMSHPLRNAENPTIYFIAVGYNYSFGDEYAFAVSLYAGGAKTNYNRNYEEGYVQTPGGPDPGPLPEPVEGIEKVSTTAAYLNLELGKHWGTGKVFITTGYCVKPFYGIGIRTYFGR